MADLGQAGIIAEIASESDIPADPTKITFWLIAAD
jgi:hypothetical protein